MKLHKSPPGVALVIVLGFLVIISALAVAFFGSVSTELKASRNFAAGVTTRQLADSAVQIVMGQIAAATTRGVDPATGIGSEAWASQPGMIRVYGAGGVASASADAFYKLYSSNKMILVGPGGDLTTFNPQSYTSTDDCYSGWDKAPALWADLNAPVMVRNTDPADSNAVVPRFPIIDPRAFADGSTAATTGTWPGNVEGFTYAAAIDGVALPGAGADNQRLPMPVRWIYVLQNGTLITPDASGTTTATFSGANVPTSNNPIVGRIAFWTDDETSKLNLNTAAGFVDLTPTSPPGGLNPLNASAYLNSPSQYPGSFWDTPRFYTQFDYGLPNATGVPASGQVSGGLALCQLLEFEFQRYPGHPATTSLAPALQTLLTSDQIYAVSPRYSNLNLAGGAGSTMGGTNRVIVDNTTTGANSLDNKEIQPKGDRLYASVDEFLFGATSTGYGSSTYARVTNNQYGGKNPTWGLPAPYSPITPEAIDKLRFFLTTQARAPELNLWGQPRIACWPVRSELSTVTTGLNLFDNLMVFCSTAGTYPAAINGARTDTQNNYSSAGLYRYIFTRHEVVTAPTGTSYTSLVSHQSPLDPANTYPQKQYEFNSASYPVTLVDCEQSRNKYLLGTYLPTFLTTPIPGVGQAMSAKYDAYDRQNILAEIFDYIRLANSHDTTTLISTGKPIPFAPRGNVPPSMPSYMKVSGTQAKGFGRVSTLSEVSLVFYYAGPQMETNPAFVPLGSDGKTAVKGAAPNTGWSKWDPQAQTSRYAKVTLDGSGKNPKVAGGYMRAFLLFSTFDPMQGYAPKFDPGYSDPKLSIECNWPNNGTNQGDWSVTLDGPGGVGSGGTFRMGFVPQGGFPSGKLPTTTINRSGIAYWGGRHVGGYEGFMHTLNGGLITSINSNTATPNLNWLAPYKIMWDPTHPLTSSDIGSTTFNAGTPLAGTNNSPFTSIGTGTTMPVVPANVTVNNTSYPMANATLPMEEYYPFQTTIGTAPATATVGGPIPIPGPGTIAPNAPTGNTFSFNPGGSPTQPNLIVKMYYGSSGSTATSNSTRSDLQPLQEFDLYFPPTSAAASSHWPIPQGPPYANNGVLGYVTAQGSPQAGPTADVTTWEPMPTDDGFMKTYYWSDVPNYSGTGTFFPNYPAGRLFNKAPNVIYTNWSPGVYKYYTSLQASWSFATRLAWCTAPIAGAPGATFGGSGPAEGGASYDPYAMNEPPAAPIPQAPGYFGDRWRCIVQPGDTIRSLLYWNAAPYNGTTGFPNGGSGTFQTAGGDLRVGALTPVVAPADFREHPAYTGPQSRACVLRGGDGTRYFPQGAPAHNAYSTNANDPTLGNHVTLAGVNVFGEGRAFANLPWWSGQVTVNGVVRGKDGKPGDFDTGMGDFADGPFINKQDEGNVIYSYLDYNALPVYPVPYFTHTWSYEAPGNTFTSPSRQMPSPAMIGSLPSLANKGLKGSWQTLALCPNTPDKAGTTHPGNIDPKDHYLLDLFMTPVVEPYPISEPFSTAGKVNLNYRIAPFDYIRRSTALRGALYPIRVAAVPSSHYNDYKTGNPNPPTLPDGSNMPLTVNFRYPLDRDRTIQSFDGFYDGAIGSDPSSGFFKAASQICERWLYPLVSTAPPFSPGESTQTEASLMQGWWATNGDLTGDNVREKPYVDLYPRITTKSNTYTVHMKVQTLRQAPRGTTGNYANWVEGKDLVLGEYRGSSTIERYIDPADPRFSTTYSPASARIIPDTQSVEPLYRFRTVINKKFSP